MGRSRRKACELVGLNRATFYYATRKKDDTVVREKIRTIAERYPRYGQPRIHWVLNNREGLKVNHKKVSRIYREEGLSLRLKKRKRRASAPRVPLAAPTRPNELWAMDFMFDSLVNGRRFKVFTLIDVFTRESLALHVDYSIGGRRVVDILERVGELRGLPMAITSDNGSEFTCRLMDEWAHRRKVKLDFIKPGKPTQNAFAESFNGKLRDECLAMNQFVSIAEAEVVIKTYGREFNDERPHHALGEPPSAFAARHQSGLNSNCNPKPQLSLV